MHKLNMQTIITNTRTKTIVPITNINKINKRHLLKNVGNINFCFVIPSYNNEKNIVKNLHSVINQTYTNWRVIYINDCSTDKTEELFFDIIKKNKKVETKFTYIKNEKQYKQMYCKHMAYSLVNDLEIVCLLDGDDWLYDNKVLDKLYNYYKNTDTKIITSNYKIYSDGKIINNSIISPHAFYTPDEIINNKIRFSNNWYLKHLKTGYGILFKSISDTYFKYNNNWLDTSTDRAEMYSACEFSNGSVIQVNDLLHVYNKDNSILYNNSFYNTPNSKDRIQILTHLKKMPICKYYFPHTCIINMHEDLNKKINMQKQMQTINKDLPDFKYEFIDAVNGYQDINTSKMYKEYQTQYRNSHTIRDRGLLKLNYQINKQHITLGSLGLLQSAFKLLESFVKDVNNSHIMILEEDVFVLKDFRYYLFINNKMLENKDLIYLGCHTDFHRIYNENVNDRDVFINIKKKNYLIYGTYAIIVSKKIAEYILNFKLENIIKLNLSWDLFLNYIRETTDMSFYLYFKEMFLPDVCKDGINGKMDMDMSFYTDKGMNLDLYFR